LMDKTKEKIRAFMIENFLFGEDNDLKDDTSFLEEGIIDSTGVLELIEYLEEEFNLQIDDEDLIPENLDSLNNLEHFIARLLKSS